MCAGITMVYSELPEISFGWWALALILVPRRRTRDKSRPWHFITWGRCGVEAESESEMGRRRGGAAFHSRYLKCPLWEAGDTMWSRNECWRTNIPKRKQRRWKAACCAVSRKGIPSMSWERERPFAAVAGRWAHTAVNEPPSAERWHNIGKSADNSWLTSKLSVKKKKMKNAARVLDLCKTPKKKQKNAANKRYLSKDVRSRKSRRSEDDTLFVCCFVVYLPNCRDFDNSFQMAARGLLIEISWPQAVWAILPALLRLHESCHHMFNGL